MDRLKLKAMRTLARARFFILATDEEATMYGNADGMEEMMAAHSVQMMINKAQDIVESLSGKDAPDGGKHGRRSKSRKDQ